MRIRAVLAALLILLLAACSGEAGPTPDQAPEDPGPDALLTKLDALTADECFRLPDDMHPPDCEKYITQVANVPERALDYAETDHPDLREAANNLDSGIQDYRDHKCGQETHGDDAACPTALNDVAEALAAVQTGVAELPDTAETPR